MTRSLGLLLVATQCASHSANAQPPADPAPSEQPPADQTRTLDIGDLLHLVRHQDAQPSAPDSKRFLVATPSIGSKPSTGFTAGFSSNMAFYAGERDTTHLSTVSAGAKFSQLGQTTTGIRLNIFTPDDRWVLQSDDRLQWTSANTYDLGGNSATGNAVKLKYDYFRLNETAYRRVEPGLFVGAGLSVSIHSNVGPGGSAASIPAQAAYAAYSTAHGFPIGGQTSAGTSDGILYDTRDNSINADRGVLANAVYHLFQWIPRRRVDVAVAEYRRADLPAAHARCPSEAGVLVPR